MIVRLQCVNSVLDSEDYEEIDLDSENNGEIDLDTNDYEEVDLDTRNYGAIDLTTEKYRETDQNLNNRVTAYLEFRNDTDVDLAYGISGVLYVAHDVA